MTKLEFSEWLVNQLQIRGWKQADLAQQSRISPAQITRAISGERGMGEATLQKIARAFQIPISDVYRAAGLLPPVTPKTALLESIDHVISELSEEEQNNVLEYARLRNRISHGKGNNQESIQK